MVKGKIDKTGYLRIIRGNYYKKQECPFVSYAEGESGLALCGDWCPQFGEPYKRDLCDPMGEHPYISKETYLNICEQRVLEFDELIDERPTE